MSRRKTKTMAAKKTNQKKTKKKTVAGKKKPELTDKELIKIQKELEATKGKSILIEEDLKRMRAELNACVPYSPVKKKAEVTLRHYKFVCKTCVNPFEHKATMPVIEQRFMCPKCRKEHVLEIHPTTVKNYRILLPNTVKIRK